MGNGPSKQERMMNTLFQIKFQAKQFEKESAKCVKKANKQKKMTKKCIEAGQLERARIYASNAIREKNQGNQYLRMASRLDAVRSKIEQANAVSKMTPQMARITKQMGSVLGNINVMSTAETMERFEQITDNLDVVTKTMNGAMDGAMSSSTPEDEVDSLINEVAEEHGLASISKMDAAPTLPIAVNQNKDSVPVGKEAELEERLRKLRDGAMTA